LLGGAIRETDHKDLNRQPKRIGDGPVTLDLLGRESITWPFHLRKSHCSLTGTEKEEVWRLNA
jgi:hypothetical protein